MNQTHPPLPSTEEDKIRALFQEKGAILQGHFYRLSGRHTDWYVQCARLFENHRTGELVGRALADKCRDFAPEVVLSAAIGGVLPGYEVARALGLNLFYCEKRDGALILRRGFTLRPGARVLIVEDEISTGQSIREMMEIVHALDGVVAGVGCLVDKSGGTAPLNVPLVSLITLNAAHYRADVCPMCQKEQPLQNLR